jgi:hypothetical protein
MPWPPPEAAAAEYAPVYETFIKPAVQALRDRQVRCLSSTLVCAYTRPVAVDKLPAYAAFDKNPKLRQLCLDVREKLLKHDARFMVNLKDVDDIDPKFAAALRKSGVNNSFGQKQGVRDRLSAADLTGDDAPMPPAPPPGGGVAFEDLAPAPPPPRSRSNSPPRCDRCGRGRGRIHLDQEEESTWHFAMIRSSSGSARRSRRHPRRAPGSSGM